MDRLVQTKVIEPVRYFNSHLEQYPNPTLDDRCEKVDRKETIQEAGLEPRLFATSFGCEIERIYHHKHTQGTTDCPMACISSAPAIFQRTMENILQGKPHVVVYLDDIILTGATKAQHLETLDMVLGRLEEAGLRLKVAF